MKPTNSSSQLLIEALAPFNASDAAASHGEIPSRQGPESTLPPYPEEVQASGSFRWMERASPGSHGPSQRYRRGVKRCLACVVASLTALAASNARADLVDCPVLTEDSPPAAAAAPPAPAAAAPSKPSAPPAAPETSAASEPSATSETPATPAPPATPATPAPPATPATPKESKSESSQFERFDGDPEKEEDKTGKLTTSGSTGISDSTDPTVSFIGDANITNIDTQKLALGFGLERAAPWNIARAVVRFNPNGTLDTTIGSRDLGVAIDSPGTATFSVSGRFQHYFGAYIQGCRVTGKTERHIHTKWGHGLYGSAEIARLLVNVTSKGTGNDMSSDPNMISGAIIPVAVAVGYFLRLDGRLPPSLNLGSQFVLAPYIGGAGRYIDDDLHERRRKDVLGSSKRLLGGLEAGATLQFGNFVFEPRATFLTNGDHHINGLSGAQLQITLSYSLLLGGEPAVTPTKKSAASPSS